MILLIFALLLTGASLSLAECPEFQEITTTCQTDHLKHLPPDAAQQLGSFQGLTDPKFILGLNLEAICEDAAAVKEYFKCVFTNISDCLQKVNSSMQDMLPDPDIIGQAFQDFCVSYKEININISCINDGIEKAQSCYTGQAKDSSDVCSTFEIVQECFNENAGDCQGSETVLDYLLGTKPEICAGTTQKLTLSLLLFVAFAFFLKKDD